MKLNVQHQTTIEAKTVAVVINGQTIETVLHDDDGSAVAQISGLPSCLQSMRQAEHLPLCMHIDIKTGVLLEWYTPTAADFAREFFPNSADALPTDVIESMRSLCGFIETIMHPHAPAAIAQHPIYGAQYVEAKRLLGEVIANPATTTPEIQQPVKVAEPVQPEFAETAPEAPQSNCGESAIVKQVEIEPIKPVENHQIDALPSDAFDQGVALAESVLVPVEPEPVAVEPVEDESLRRRTPAQPRYRNPDDHDQTWTGRGKQPEWLRQQIANGKNLEDFLIGANPSPVAAQGSDHPENIEGLPVVVVEHPSKDKWVANFLGETATSTQGLYESIKGVLKRCNMSGAYEIKKLKTIGEAEVFTIDDSRTANTETVYLSKGADGWIAKTPKNKSVTAAISITGELTALLEPIDNIDDHANAVIVETTDDEIRSRGKRRYSITAGQTVDVAAPAHAPSAPEEQPATYAEIVQLINFASEVAHLDNIKAMRIDHHGDEKERHALVMKLGSKRAEIMAANAMRIK